MKIFIEWKYLLLAKGGDVGPCKKGLANVHYRLQESLRKFQEQKIADEWEARNPFKYDWRSGYLSLQDSRPNNLSRQKRKAGIASYFPSNSHCQGGIAWSGFSQVLKESFKGRLEI